MNFKTNKLLLYLLILFSILISSCNSTDLTSQTTPTSLTTTSPDVITSPTVTPVSARVIGPDNVHELQILDQWGKGDVFGVALSPDEAEIAVSTVTGVYIFDSQTLQEKQFIDLPIVPKAEWRRLPSKSISFSPDGNLFALGFEDVIIWNLSENKNGKRLSNRIADYDIIEIAYSPRGDTIGVISMGTYTACDAWGGNFALYSIASGKLLYDEFFCPESSLFYFTFLDNGNVAFVGRPADDDEWRYKLSIINASTGILIREYRLKGVVDSISPDGFQISRRYDPPEYFAATQIIDLDTQNKIGEEIDGIVIFLPGDEKRLVQSEDGWVITTSDNSEICHFENNPSLIFDVYRSPYTITKDKLIFWDDWHENVEVWDLAQCKRIKQLFMPTGFFSPEYSNDGKNLAVAGWSDIYVFDGKNGQYRYSILGDSNVGPGQYFDFGKDLKTGVNVSNDIPYTITFWDLVTGRKTLSIPTKFEYIQSVSISPDERIVTTTDYDGVHIWNIKKQELLTTIPGRYGNLFWNPDGSNFVLEDGNSLVFHNAENGQIERRISFPKDRINAVISNDWKNIAIIEQEKIELWDMNGNKLKDLMEYSPIMPTDVSAYLHSVQFSPDNNLIAAIYIDFTSYGIRFWDTQTGVIIRDLPVPFRISDMLFSPDGERLTLFGDGVIYHVGVKVP